MKTFTEIKTDFANKSHDSNYDPTQDLNDAIHYVMSLADWNFNKDSVSYTSVASQQDYPRPAVAAKIRYMNVFTGNQWYTPTEIKDGKLWRQLNYTQNNFADQPQYWFTSNNSLKCSLFPIPTNAGNTINIGYTKRLINLGVADYSTGSVSATAGATTITGSITTAFNAAMAGSYITVSATNSGIDGLWFEILSVTDAHTLVVKQQIPVALSGASYTVAQMVPFMDGFEDIALYRALDRYYRVRELESMADAYKKDWETMLDEMKTRDFRSSDELVKKQRPVEIINSNLNQWSINLIP